MPKQKRKTTKFIKVFLWGILVVGLYTGLYLNETEIVQWTAEGKWTFIVPIVIAFVFSFAHGNFTGEFWNVLGIKPKLSGDKK